MGFNGYVDGRMGVEYAEKPPHHREGTNGHGAAPEPPPNDKELVEEFRDHIDQLAGAINYDPHGFRKDVASISGRLRQVEKAGGPRQTLELGFASLIQVATQIVVRLKAGIDHEINLACETAPHDDHKGRRLRLPDSARPLLTDLDFVGNFYLKLADSYAKFEHLGRLNKGDRGRQEQPD